jgi:flagellar motor switch/type III secretory pathway protein FliN
MSTAEIRDLCLLSATTCQQLQSALQARVADVVKPWVPAAALNHFDLGISALDPLAHAGIDWQCSDDGLASVSSNVWQAHAGDAAQLLAHLLVSADAEQAMPAHDWSLGAAEQLITQLNACLGQVSSAASPSMGYPSSQLATALMPFSGAVVLDMSALGMRWLLLHSTYQNCLQSAAPSKANEKPAPLSAAGLVSDQHLTLEVGLGQVDISVAELMGLQVGDVVRFPALLDTPLAAEIVSAHPSVCLLKVELGQRQSRLAVKVVDKIATR